MAATAPIDIRQFKVRSIPEQLVLMRQAHEGPRPILADDVTSLETSGGLFLHVSVGEFQHLEKFLDHPMTGTSPLTEGNIITKVTSIHGSLRLPWEHLALQEHIMDSICLSLRLLSEGRLHASVVDKSFVSGITPSPFGEMHQLMEHQGLASFCRRNLSRSYQLMSHASWNFVISELGNMEIIEVHRNLHVFNHLCWAHNIPWDYHVPIDIGACIDQSLGDHLIANIRNALQHAGLHLLGSESEFVIRHQEGLDRFVHQAQT
eukprot:s35_g19.t1